MDPLLVQVTCEGPDRRHRVYVNWQPVERTELSGVLRKELKHRPPNWPVYVEGDPAEDWQWVVKGIDTIRSVQGEAYLLTTWRGVPRGQLEAKSTQKAPGIHTRGRQ
jgi:hypothetical protein